MPNLLAMSFEGELAPSFTLHCLEEGHTLPDGWGLGYYPAGEPSAAILKEPAPPQASIRSQLALAWEQVASSVFVLHIRAATWGALSDANTQPFSRTWGRRDWLMAHAGSLDRKPTEVPGPFEAVGSTDTEAIFCALLNRFVERGWRSLAEVDLAQLTEWINGLNEIGELTLCLTDGRDLLVHADRRGAPLHLGTLSPPYEKIAFGDVDLEVDLTRRGAKSRKGAVVCTDELAPGDGDATRALAWRRLAPGTLLVIREGAVVVEHSTGGELETPRAKRRPARAEPRTFDVVHRTTYKYTKAVERSSHVFRLTPLHDRMQSLREHTLTISVPAQGRDYEDVFGNRVHRIAIETPYDEMVIEAKSVVEVNDVDPLGFGPLRVHSTIPLVWMPWQRQVLDPFLLPPELPESELAELAEYAMSFVNRNDYDLLDTLLDMNQTIFREYAYQQGTTNNYTTAFETYCNRRGVCQDFTNLMICLARLLGVPARYVCGYVYTGPKSEDANHRQGEASHAWVQLYLPQVGWKGFDPTNGILTQTDHVRTAVGRNRLDATPTSGTIYVGGGGETLSVDVIVEPHVKS
ncbi:MAG: class II glutamine amidotransferase [Deltaproteobacteria bacterium]|nr:class II glutamine amidotransferase [Deltaproteobacteria bacterium]MCW5804984.1 class II glutamine amidotransferase [Deltaproteobacteria bacterium]